MGVQNLWMLLAPVGRQIEIETLASNVLAVDASIWLTQFIKAMRDDEGNMIKNAHLIGTFHRVAKLLFYRIRPVFVFDGNTPEIKKRTVARRRKRQDFQAANLKQTAQRILLNRLKLYREELKKNGGKPPVNSAVAPDFVLPGTTQAKAAAEANQEEVIAIDDSEDEQSDDKSTTEQSAVHQVDDLTSSKAPVVVDGDEEMKSSGDYPSDDDDMTADDIVLDASRLSRIDLDAVFALPGHLQKDMIARIQRDRRQEAREEFIPLAGNPEAYSRTQIMSFLKTSQLNRQIMKARKKNAQLEMEKAAAEADEEESVHGLAGNGRRIASSSDRFFIYEKGKRHDSDEDSEDESGSHQSNRNEAADWKLSGSLELPAEVEDDEDIFDRIHGSKRKHRYLEEGSVVVKKSLADFSVASVEGFATEVGRAQRRKIAVEEARRKFMEKTQAAQSDKQAVTELDGIDRPPLKMETHPEPNADNITITFKTEDVKSLDEQAEALFPSSMFDTSKAIESEQVKSQRDADEDDADDVDWEDVPTAEVTRPVAEPVQTTQEEEKSPKDEQMPLSAVELPQSDQTDSQNALSKVAIRLDEDSDDDVQWEDVSGGVATTKDSLDQHTKTLQSPIDSSEVDQVDTETEIDPDDKDLFSSLRAEIDEERAEEDLAALRAEALQSAIATASNLTQWAAGAVRRALAQHTKMSDSPAKVHTPDRVPPPRTTRALTHKQVVVDLSQPEANNDEQSRSEAAEEAIVTVDEGDASDDRLLQLAIERSIVQDQPIASGSATNRYLQYSSPTEPEPPIDVGAIAEEQKELKKLRNRQLRDTEGVNDEMVHDVMELLQLFGVPYLVCPMEAEAQCAALEQLGLVDGIITDDSDIFPFGGKKVYKNIFHNQKFVEAFYADDVQKELGFSQEEMIALAMLLGSDYTDGVRGIGIVNASEVVAAYPGLDGLKEFKNWVQTFDVGEEARRRLEKKKSQAELDAMSPRERFEYTHASVRRKWELGDEFPNPRVAQAYKNPQVDRSDSRFSWELPNLAGLREYCTQTFGWDQSKTDTVLLPLMEQIASFANERHRHTRIDQFFTKYDDNVKYAKIQSKRLRSAVEDKTGSTRSVTKTGAASNSPAKKAKSQAKATSSTKSKFTKTKKTTSTLGL